MQYVLYVISWNLTQRCNLRCKHCYIDASKPMPGELSTAETLRVLDEIAEVNPETMLILTGGEPLMRDDLDEFVARASQLGMTVVLGTNGTHLTVGRARTLKEQGLSGAGISLDSLNAPDHDEFRGMSGAWESTVQGIDAARQAGLDVQIQMTFTRENVRELPEVVRFSRQAGARVVTVFFLVCTGRGQNVVDQTPEEYEHALQWLVGVKQDGIMIRPRCAPTRSIWVETPNRVYVTNDGFSESTLTWELARRLQVHYATTLSGGWLDPRWRARTGVLPCALSGN